MTERTANAAKSARLEQVNQKMQKRALDFQGSFHLQDFLAKRNKGEGAAYWIFDKLTKLSGKLTQIPCHCRGIPLAKGGEWGYNLLDNVFMFFGENER